MEETFRGCGYILEMQQYKAICTLTWRFSSQASREECLQFARQQLEQILETHPQGEAFEGFCIQVDLAKMKDRKALVHIAEFSPDEVFPYITQEEGAKREYKVEDQSFMVRMNSDRYFVFQNNRRCVVCGLEGTKMILDLNPGDQSPHFNLYGEKDGRLVLMTKDHIVPKSRGGPDALGNYQTMCSCCNNLKANYDLTPQQVAELRMLFDNEDKLPKKELRELISNRRNEMVRESR